MQIGEVLREKSDTKYRVDFIGDNTHQVLPQDKVQDFCDNYSKHAQSKKKVNIRPCQPWLSVASISHLL